MGRISIDTIEPGMVLASDLIHSNGRFLLGKGVVLDTNHLRTLKIWGIHSVEVEGLDEENPALPEDKIDPAILNAAKESSNLRFSECDLNHPFLQEMFHICVQRKARQLLQADAKEKMPEEAEPTAQPELMETPSYLISKYSSSSLVDECSELASLPSIFMEISEVISDPRSSAVHVADVISKDTSLSAKLLKIVNSAYYNFPSKIDTISRAVTIIGSRQLSTLALGASVVRAFQGIPVSLIDMESFWKHSITCGISARMIAGYKNIPNTERLFVAGLLRDMGRILLYKRIPDMMSKILIQARRTRKILRSAEVETLGFDHAYIGEILLKKWKLPLVLEQAVAHHHAPLKSSFPMEVSIVHLSDILANTLEMGTSGERLIPPLIPEAWSFLGLEKEMFAGAVQLIERQVEEIIHHFFN
jgi:HD-like signal output (HDOD) protein